MRLTSTDDEKGGHLAKKKAEELTAEELRDKIKTLEDMDESDAAQPYRDQLAILGGKSEEKGDTVPEEVEGIMLPVDDKTWEESTSKFITIPAGKTSVDLPVEMGMPAWDTPGKSVKFPVTVTAKGPDYGKEDKISGGVEPGKTFKTKEIVEAVTGAPCPMAKGKDGKMHPVIPASIGGMPAIGHWELQTGTKGGVPGAEPVKYPKLVSILPVGSETEDLM